MHPNASPCQADSDHVWGPWTRLRQAAHNDAHFAVQYIQCVRCNEVRMSGYADDADQINQALEVAAGIAAAERASNPAPGSSG